MTNNNNDMFRNAPNGSCARKDEDKSKSVNDGKSASPFRLSSSQSFQSIGTATTAASTTTPGSSNVHERQLRVKSLQGLPVIESHGSISSDDSIEHVVKKHKDVVKLAQSPSHDTSTRRLVWYLTTEFVPKLVLEVWGGAGAIWGFSEAVTLRRPETIWFWRPCALVVGALFFLRFLYQVKLAVDVFYGQSRVADLVRNHSYDLELGESNIALQIRLAQSLSTTDSSSDGCIETTLMDHQKAYRSPHRRTLTR